MFLLAFRYKRLFVRHILGRSRKGHTFPVELSLFGWHVSRALIRICQKTELPEQRGLKKEKCTTKSDHDSMRLLNWRRSRYVIFENKSGRVVTKFTRYCPILYLDRRDCAEQR